MIVEEKILDRAHELFVKQGIKSVTMDELAQSLGMSKRTIYEHYGDKKHGTHQGQSWEHRGNPASAT